MRTSIASYNWNSEEGKAQAWINQQLHNVIKDSIFFILPLCCPQFHGDPRLPAMIDGRGSPRCDTQTWRQPEEQQKLSLFCVSLFKSKTTSPERPPAPASIPCWTWVTRLKKSLVRTNTAGESPTVMTTETFPSCISDINVISSSRCQIFPSLWKSKS